MSKPKDNEQPVVKAKLIEGEAIRLSPKLDVNTDLADIITECTKILNDTGYKDYFLAIENGRDEKTVYHNAGLAILHANQAISKIEEKDSGDAAYNAMRAVQFQNLAIMQHRAIANKSLADKKSRTGALLINKFSSDELLQLRTEMVLRLRLEKVMEAMIPRNCARIEGNYHSAGMVPKSKVDKMRKYLIAHNLIKPR